MAFESEEKKTDFESWAEAMTYEEEKELKRQEKIQLKQEKQAEKAARKAAKNKKTDSTESDNSGTPMDQADSVDSVNLSETVPQADAESEENTENTSQDNASDSEGEAGNKEEAEEDKKDEEYNPDYIKVKKAKNPEEVNIVKELLSLIIYIGVVIILCFLIITYVGQRTTVNGRSMENTLHDGDNLWIDKFTYHFKDPERFDIVVFPYEDDVYYIKRVIGLPGETVQILPDGTILIDGQRLVESYGKEIILESGTAAEERTLGEDEYFVLGDNRNDSRDSRWADVGDINKDDIIGKAVLRLSPIKQFGKLDK